MLTFYNWFLLLRRCGNMFIFYHFYLLKYCLYGLHGPPCPLSPKRLSNLITPFWNDTGSWNPSWLMTYHGSFYLIGAQTRSSPNFGMYVLCANQNHWNIHSWCILISGLILGLHPANERCRYKVTPSLIGWGANLEAALYMYSHGHNIILTCCRWSYCGLSLWHQY